MITITFGLDGSAADEEGRPFGNKAIRTAQQVSVSSLGFEGFIAPWL